MKNQKALEYCIDRERENIDIFGSLYPCPQSRDYLYDGQTNYEWTNSFYTGMLWLAYEMTKEECFMKKRRSNPPISETDLITGLILLILTI